MSTQMTMGLNMGARSGMETARPFASGDTVVKHDGSRYVVDHVDANNDGVVLVCVNLRTGLDAVVLVREVAYRSTNTTHENLLRASNQRRERRDRERRRGF